MIFVKSVAVVLTRDIFYDGLFL